jgi:alpha-L-fucosidase 2
MAFALSLSICCLLIHAGSSADGQDLLGTPSPNVLWYRKPATDWEKQALPIGNGRLGCMVFGGVDREHIQFNEDTLWIGDEKDTGSYQTFGDIYMDFGANVATVGLSNPS